MTDRDEIELPPLPTRTLTVHSDDDLMDYARAAVIADRKRRAEQAKPAKPKVHSKWIELFPDGEWTTSPGLASYQNTSTMLNICWTNGGRVWINNERNRELAQGLRMWQPLGAMGNEAADALDGGVR